MVYLERAPEAPLNRWIRSIWYAKAPDMPHRRERVLPNGCVQIVINLDRDYIQEWNEGGEADRLAPSLIVGARSVYGIVDSGDMAEVAGVLFEPGGFPPFAADATDMFSNRNVALEDVWGARAGRLRDRLREESGARAKLCAIEDFLRRNFAARFSWNSPVEFALQRFAEAPGVATVKCVAAETGWCVRRFSEIFREQVGVTPKVWCRIQRFQTAVRQLHAGADVRWAELAIECGYYDQAHFANEFRAFSGIDATTYSARRTRWANHIPVD